MQSRLQFVAGLLFVSMVVLQARAAEVRVLDAPDFKTKPVAQAKGSLPFELRQASATANRITDTAEWFEKNRLSLNEPKKPVRELPDTIEGMPRLKVIHSLGGRFVGIYGPGPGAGRYVAILSELNFGEEQFVEAIFDFVNYQLAPRNVAADLEFVKQGVVWAQESEGVLYVSHGHSTYAKSSHGMNAYVSAIDMKTGKALWHSAPLVSNAANFQLLKEHIATGYGFTEEPDFLYILSKRDGSAILRLPLKSGPEYIIGGAWQNSVALYVRTYNTDYVFEVIRK